MRSIVVETMHGHIAGSESVNGVCIFKGVRYGESTEGIARFLPPQKPIPWQGVRNALQLGPQCPQATTSDYVDNDASRFYAGAVEPQPYRMSEDCLFLNIWTPGIHDNTRRPVMVWCHGGGFEYGSGGADWYDGANLSLRGDVVVVTLNHRLNVFGFLHLADFGSEKFRDAGNAGLLDIIGALQWVRDNIEAFGGDPNNVTLFGSSGGACKITALLAMPGARGLFHKAILQSGVVRQYQRVVGTAGDKKRVAAQLIEELLQAKVETLDALQKIPGDELLTALRRVQRLLGDDFGMRCCSPVIDGKTLPVFPFDPVAPEVSAHIPLLIGTTADESRLLHGADAFSLDSTQLFERLRYMLQIDNDRINSLIDAYRTAYPDASASDLFFSIASDHHFRTDALLQIESKAQQNKAPVYAYRFDWPSPAADGKFRAAHGTELPFIFENLDKAPGAIGTITAEKITLANRISQAWVAFARYGNPNHSDIPTWKSYDQKERSTMLINDEWQSVPTPKQHLLSMLTELKSFEP